VASTGQLGRRLAAFCRFVFGLAVAENLFFFFKERQYTISQLCIPLFISFLKTKRQTDFSIITDDKDERIKLSRVSLKTLYTIHLLCLALAVQVSTST
jgi:hypothetical protein